MSPNCDKSLKNLAFELPLILVGALTSGSFIFCNQEARGWVVSIKLFLLIFASCFKPFVSLFLSLFLHQQNVLFYTKVLILNILLLSLMLPVS